MRNLTLILVLLLITGCGAPPPDLPKTQHRPDSDYILLERTRPTHWSQEQWEVLDRYLKRIDELEDRVEELEKQGTP